jgi:hypothetical protein
VPKEKERDWDREMAEVDKLLAKLPAADPSLGRGAAPSPARQGPAGAGLAGTAAGHTTAADHLGTWIKVGLGLLVGIGMIFWPYSHACGFRLWFYLGAAGTVVVAGVWSSISSWRSRLGLAHTLSQGLIIWGLVLAAGEVLPRIGYAKDAATWLCP